MYSFIRPEHKITLWLGDRGLETWHNKWITDPYRGQPEVQRYEINGGGGGVGYAYEDTVYIYADSKQENVKHFLPPEQVITLIKNILFYDDGVTLEFICEKVNEHCSLSRNGVLCYLIDLYHDGKVEIVRCKDDNSKPYNKYYLKI